MSTVTWAMTAPFLIAVTFPLRAFLALIFIVVSPLLEMGLAGAARAMNRHRRRCAQPILGDFHAHGGTIYCTRYIDKRGGKALCRSIRNGGKWPLTARHSGIKFPDISDS